MLYPPSLRDLHLTLAALDAFEVRWSEAILEELRRSVVANHPEIGSERFESHTVGEMRRHFPDALVAVSQNEIDRLDNHPKDRHVAAAAIVAAADAVVTINIRDFRSRVLDEAGIAVVTPGRLAEQILDDAPEVVEQAIRRIATRWTKPPRQWIDVVEPVDVTGRAPFAFDANSRILGVLKHPTFSETTVPAVFETLLQQGEEARGLPSTDWAVEPILDDANFLQWPDRPRRPGSRSPRWCSTTSSLPDNAGTTRMDEHREQMPAVGFWHALGKLSFAELKVEGSAALILGIGAALALLSTTDAPDRVEVAGDHLVIAAPLLGIVFAAAALVIALFNDEYWRVLNANPDGVAGFLRPFMLAIGAQVGTVLLAVAYRAGAEHLDSRVEVGAFVVLSVLFVFATLDVVALGRTILRHGHTRAKAVEVRDLEAHAENVVRHRKTGR